MAKSASITPIPKYLGNIGSSKNSPCFGFAGVAASLANHFLQSTRHEIIFNKLKTITLAAVIAAATLFGGGKAWALDLDPDVVIAAHTLSVPGCGDITVSTATFPLQRRFRVSDGSSLISDITYVRGASSSPWVLRDAINNGQPASYMAARCPGLSSVSCAFGTPIISTQAAFDAASFTGSSWTGTDNTDGIQYRYFMGWEGVNGTIHVFRREAANQAPTADAGPDQTVASAAAVTLDGTGSSDPDAGQTLTYAWTQTGGDTVTLSDATAVGPSFTAPTLAAGEPDQTLTFSLIVTDNLGLASNADTVKITVISGPSVTLSGGPVAIANTDPFTVTATFSKDVTGL